VTAVPALRCIEDPSPPLCGDNEEQFLRNLGGPCGLLLPGEDRSRCRAFVTLLHGNEPSGLLALRDWLLSGRRPAVDLLCVVGSVEAALATPLFSHRMLPGQRDLNRCFRPPFDDAQGELAASILALLRAHRPEAVVDMHNTSGTGPAFGVCAHLDHQHDALVSLFTRRLIVSHHGLGALMELSDRDCPTVTVEVGGRQDDDAHRLARETLPRYFLAREVISDAINHDWGLEILRNPLRLELLPHTRFGYGEAAQSDCDVTLRRDIEHHNFGTVDEGTCLGWINAEPSRLFRALDANGRCAVSSLLRARGGRLYPARPLKLFMITSSDSIARSDCLCYAVADDGSPVLSAA
jgi:hypothetical protein